jgi:hypothetical protein
MMTVDPQLDLPHNPGDQPLWSENYMFCGYDPSVDVGFYHHLGTLPHDPSQWGGMFCAVLSEGALVVIKDYGLGEAGPGPASPGLAFICDEPLRRWTLTKTGVGYPTSNAELLRGLLTDRNPVAVDFRAGFTGSAPVWDMGEHMETAAFHTHHQQAGRVTGRMRIGDSELTFAGAGYRDHSVGPRDVRGLVSHTWFHAWMPSGRILQGLSMNGLGGVSKTAGYLSDGVTVQPAEVVTVPSWTGPTGAPSDFVVEVKTDAGAVTVTGTTRRTIPWTLESPNEILLGQDHARPGALLSFSALSSYRWDGEEGPGLLEMSLRTGTGGSS